MRGGYGPAGLGDPNEDSILPPQMRDVDGQLSLTINYLVSESHRIAKEKGWWEEWDRNFGELMMLSVTELSESFEHWRNGRKENEMFYDGDKPDGVPVEIADVFIRLADLCGRYEIDIDAAIRAKMAYNETRPHRHGGKKA